MTELVKVESKRPYRKYSQEQMIKALEESRGLIAPAARALGCSRDTIRSYLEEYSAVAQAKLDQREAVTDMAENSLYEAIRRGEAWAVCFYLKCMAKDRGYVERAELTGSNGARGRGVPKKPSFWGTRRGHQDVFTRNPSLHLKGRQ
jgi:DNA-binding transcriptional MerR regulator